MSDFRMPQQINENGMCDNCKRPDSRCECDNDHCIYKQGFEDGKKATLERVNKILQKELPGHDFEFYIGKPFQEQES